MGSRAPRLAREVQADGLTMGERKLRWYIFNSVHGVDEKWRLAVRAYSPTDALDYVVEQFGGGEMVEICEGDHPVADTKLIVNATKIRHGDSEPVSSVDDETAQYSMAGCLYCVIVLAVVVVVSLAGLFYLLV